MKWKFTRYNGCGGGCQALIEHHDTDNDESDDDNNTEYENNT